MKKSFHVQCTCVHMERMVYLITFPPPSGVQSRALSSGPVRGMKVIVSISATVSSKKFSAMLEQEL